MNLACRLIDPTSECKWRRDFLAALLVLSLHDMFSDQSPRCSIVLSRGSADDEWIAHAT